MLLNFVVLVLILLVAAYYSSQGLFTATLNLIAAVFASLISMACYPLGLSDLHSRAICLLLPLFMFALGLCKLAANRAVPKAIKFTKTIDSVGGGIMGFFAALVIVGTVVIGFDMLPLHTEYLGFDRYPEDSGMKGDQPGQPARPGNLWVAPDRFTLFVWNAGSGHGLGGDQSYAAVHPDQTVESYGYRNVAIYGSLPLAPSSLVPEGRRRRIYR